MGVLENHHGRGVCAFATHGRDGTMATASRGVRGHYGPCHGRGEHPSLMLTAIMALPVDQGLHPSDLRGRNRHQVCETWFMPCLFHF